VGAVYVTVFVSAFLAATIIPFSSEIAVTGALAAGAEPGPLIAVATLGNTLGAVVGWWLGRLVLRFRDRRWFPASPSELERAQRWFQRFGVWSLLLAWLPIGGDALTVVAGVMRVRLDVFVALVGIGKGLRYAVVVGLLDGLIGR
jgi:membrane protein YqaA with SNARE-associated domain